MGIGLAIIGVSLLLVAAVSRYLTGTPFTPAMVVVAIGVLVGPLVLDRIDLQPTSATVRTLAEATLAVVLFSDSSRVNLRALKREASIPVRLLGIGLFLTIAAGGLAGKMLFGSFSLNDALILAVVLAPTDAGLGSAVVTDTRLPQVVRQSLNVESGLNDGICVPLLLILLGVAGGPASHPLRIVSEEIGYGILSGLGAAVLSSGIVIFTSRRNMIDATWRQIIPLATTLAAYGGALALGGSGFIAAFVAGATFGVLAVDHLEDAMRLTEETGVALDSVTFLVFGAVLLGPEFKEVSWQIVVYAVLSLTLVRMVPVALALLGSHARLPTVAFMGWFGPRGLASIVFAVIVEDAHIPHAAAIATITYLTVALSVLVHGLTAAPLVDRYVRWFKAESAKATLIESKPTHEHRWPLRATAGRVQPAPNP
ncbi:MAG: cation:proton antiporter [Acidimicrobiales bacterium]